MSGLWVRAAAAELTDSLEEKKPPAHFEKFKSWILPFKSRYDPSEYGRT